MGDGVGINNYRDPKWIGQRFGHLVVQKHGGRGCLECKCDCGRVITIKGSHLINHRQVTCGKDCQYHVVANKTHGLSKDRLYRIWKGMKRRCYDPNAARYSIYGGRGIDVCEEWRDDLPSFREWALSHGYADDLTIDRIDSDRGYSPDNCRWSTVVEQNRHLHHRWTFTPKVKYVTRKKRTWEIDGVEKSIKRWCEEYGITEQAVLYRMRQKGMTLKEALTTPKAQGARR